jgi:hypothetical protein
MTSSLVEKLNNSKRTHPGLPCGIKLILDKLEGDEKKALELVFDTKPEVGNISNIQLHDILVSEGHNVAYASVRMHRRKRCRCYVSKAITAMQLNNQNR